MSLPIQLPCPSVPGITSAVGSVQLPSPSAPGITSAVGSVQLPSPDGHGIASTDGSAYVEMQQAILETHAQSLQIRPNSTSKAYSARQQEYQQWCIEKRFIDGATVTGDKLHLFLHQRVIGRDFKKSKGSDGRACRKVGKSTVLGYTAAIVDLWKQQTAMRVTSHPNPRDSNVKRLLKNAEYETHQHRKANFVDRGIGTLVDGYTTTEQMVNIAEVFWKRSRDFGQNLRNLCAFFLSHYALLRGETVRNLDLADMHSVQLENEGFSICHAVVFVVRQGKTNQFGRSEFGAFIRSKDVRICPFGVCAFYLFWRYHLENEAFPEFQSNEDWFDIKFLKSGKNPFKSLDYRAHKASIDLAFREIGLSTKAKTHAARGSGARMAELAGASEDQIRRLGRWNNQSMENCYLTSLPREAIRTLAGFPPSQGSFFLHRSAIDPPLALKQMIFPAVEQTLQHIKTGEYQQSLAAKGFLELLDRLRTVILQDSVLMKHEHPGHPLWNHGIFSSDLYIRFMHDLQRSLDVQNDPTEHVLQKAMPLLSQKIQDVHTDLKSTITTAIGPVAETLLKLQNNIGDVLSGRVPVYIHADSNSRQEHVQAVMTAPTNSTEAMAAPTNSTEAMAAPTNSIDDILPLYYHPSEQAPIDVAPNTYRMSRGIKTVTDLWREWTEGLSGGPAVQDLERKWGTRWCESNERRFYNRRKKITDEIIRLARNMDGGESRNNCIAAAEILEHDRQRKEKSLDWISKQLGKS
jgi:hypothetical protein